MRQRSDPTLPQFFADYDKKQSASYEPKIDEWVWFNDSSHIWEVVPEKEVEEAYKAMCTFYGHFWDEWGDSEKDEKKKPKKKVPEPTKPCYAPGSHYFKGEILFQVEHQICTRCGYSPTLSIPAGFEQCHQEYLDYQKRVRR